MLALPGFNKLLNERGETALQEKMGTTLKLVRAIQAILVSLLVLIVLLFTLPWMYVAGLLVVKSFTDKTDWRVEDYMCTIPDGCDEYIAERKAQREQKLAKALAKTN